MDSAPTHLVHTEEVLPNESIASAGVSGSIEPGAVSSAEERHVHTVDVSGSIPLPPTTPLKGANRRHWPRRDVYFLAAEMCGLIKIGVANDVRARVRDLRATSPDWLELLGVMPCSNHGALEAELHIRFGDLRAHGEWFRPADRLVRFILTNATPVREANDRTGKFRADWEATQSDVLEVNRTAFELLTW